MHDLVRGTTSGEGAQLARGRSDLLPGKAPHRDRVSALAEGRAALDRRAWEDARDHFRAALADSASAEAWEGLAVALAYLNEVAALEAYEEAFRAYRKAGDAVGAARCALLLVRDVSEFRGDFAVANGWMRRARSLLAQVERPTAAHALMHAFEAHLALLADNDTAAARRHCAQGIAIARRVGALDEEMMLGALTGLALVSEGAVAEGMGWLDEATAAAVGGELRDVMVIGASCCYLIQACERVRDFARAAQWCERVRVLADRWRLGSFFVVCRTQYAAILMARGELATCEAELASALAHAELWRPALARAATARLGELRRRQGRFDDAETLFARVPTHRVALLGHAWLALDRGLAADAADLLEGLLDRVPAENRTERALVLEGLARAYAAGDRLPDAERAAGELAAAAATIGTDALLAAARATCGVVLAALGRHGDARRALEEAVARYDAAGERYELERTRIELARVLVALGRDAAAAEAARTAAEAFGAMGAAFEAERAKDLVAAHADRNRRGQAESRPAAATPLTPRELDVLRLIAGGSENRAIAERLALSEHTVHRHVSNILRKLDVHSRAAAAAYAVRLGLS